MIDRADEDMGTTIADRRRGGRGKIEQAYLQLKDELGLDHYEGRNWAGWRHHVSMVMMAYAFLT